MSNIDKTRNKRKRRTASIRVRDKEGNVVIRQIRRKQRRRGIPGLTWKKLPSLILGSLFALYAFMAYKYKSGAIEADSSVLENAILDYYQPMDTLIIFFLGGSFAVAVAGFLGYALIARGFKIKRWGEAFRHIIAISMAVLILSTIFSSITNERGKIRHLPEISDAPSPNQDLIDAMNSPFYQELLDGLLDLIGNIPNPDQVAATVTPVEGETFDPAVDQYLWRWTVAETYDTEKMDFIQAFENIEMDFTPTTLDESAAPDEMKQFRVNEQYLTLTTAYTGEALTTWNSLDGAMIGDPSGFSFVTSPDDANVYSNGIKVIRDANEQPVITINIDQGGTSGYIGYDAYWKEEQKDLISGNSITMNEIDTVMNNVPVDRFDQFDTADLVSQVWGEQSLPTGSGEGYAAADTFDGFEKTYNQIKGSIDGSTSVYTTMLLINNAVTSSIIAGFLDGSLNIDPETAQSAAGDGVDKAYFFFEAIDKGTTFGMQDLIAGFVNMARAFNIPARPIIGFSIGDVQTDEIEIRLEHLHLWIEALIPWVDGGTTNFSWGMFNPFPDPYLVNEGFFYGQNALGGTPDIDLRIDSGSAQELGQSIGGETAFQLHEFSEEVQADVQISYDEFVTADQVVELRILTEADLLSGSVDIFNLGTSLGTVTTDNATAWGTMKLNATRDGNLYRNYDNGTITNITDAGGITIQALNPLGTLGTYRIYSIVAIYGLSYQTIMVGWSINANISVALKMETQNIPVGADNYDAGAVIPLELFNLTAFYHNNLFEGIPNEENIDLLVMDQATFTTIESDFASGALSSSDLLPYNEGTFPITNSSGYSEMTYNFPISTPTDAIYAIVAYLRDTSIIGYTFAYVSDEVSFESILNTHDDGIKINTTAGYTWHIETLAIELNGSLSEALGFTPRYASGVALSYYAIEKDYYEANLYLQPYATLDTYVQGCSSTSGISDCFYFDPASPDAYFNVTGGLITDSNGFANATIKMSNQAFPVEDYVIVVVNQDFGSFANTSRFLVISAPIISGIEFDNVIKINDQIEPYNIPVIRSGLYEVSEIKEIDNYSPILITLLTIQGVFIISNLKEVRS